MSGHASPLPRSGQATPQRTGGMTPPLSSPTPHRSPQPPARSPCPPLHPPPHTVPKWLPEEEAIAQPAPPPPTPLNAAGLGDSASSAPAAAPPPQSQACRPPAAPQNHSEGPASHGPPSKEAGPAKATSAPRQPQALCLPAQAPAPQQAGAQVAVATSAGTPSAQESPKVTLDDIANLRSRLAIRPGTGCVPLP